MTRASFQRLEGQRLHGRDVDCSDASSDLSLQQCVLRYTTLKRGIVATPMESQRTAAAGHKAEDIMGKLDGKACIVTGTSRGIGAEIARLFAAEGGKVICAARTLKEGDHHVRGLAREAPSTTSRAPAARRRRRRRPVASKTTASAL